MLEWTWVPNKGLGDRGKANFNTLQRNSIRYVAVGAQGQDIAIGTAELALPVSPLPAVTDVIAPHALGRRRRRLSILSAGPGRPATATEATMACVAPLRRSEKLIPPPCRSCRDTGA